NMLGLRPEHPLHLQHAASHAVHVVLSQAESSQKSIQRPQQKTNHRYPGNQEEIRDRRLLRVEVVHILRNFSPRPERIKATERAFGRRSVADKPSRLLTKLYPVLPEFTN